jgi:hypothetical protein
MPDFRPNDDKYLDYYAVMEQTTPENAKVDIIDEVHQNGLNYLRFSTCLQDFYGRNRNRRLWKLEQVRTMAAQENVTELIRQKSFVGENGHPVPDSGALTLERIVTIDPNNTSHRIMSLDFKGQELHGVVETLDEGVGSPGYRFMRNILQGIIPAFSLRSLVPQRKNPDGSTDVISAGRMICYDRVYLPSHAKAYMDQEIPVQNIVTKSKFETVMESFTDYVMNHSDKVRYIVDDLDPVMESATIDKNGILGVRTNNLGTIFVSPENKYRREMSSFMRNL